MTHSTLPPDARPENLSADLDSLVFSCLVLGEFPIVERSPMKPGSIHTYIEFLKPIPSEIPEEFQESPEALQQEILQSLGHLEGLLARYYEQFDDHFADEAASWGPILARLTFLLDSLT